MIKEIPLCWCLNEKQNVYPQQIGWGEGGWDLPEISIASYFTFGFLPRNMNKQNNVILIQISMGQIVAVQLQGTLLYFTRHFVICNRTHYLTALYEIAKINIESSTNYVTIVYWSIAMAYLYVACSCTHASYKCTV